MRCPPDPAPPQPKREPHKVVFGAVPGENRGTDAMSPPIERDDDLFWLRDDERKNPEVLSYLKRENEYTEEHLRHVQPLANKVYEEIVDSIKETDDDVTFKWGSSYKYFVRTEKGKAYPIVLRKGYTTAKNSSEHIVLDVNSFAKDLTYCSIGAFKPSPCHSKLAYSIDKNGYETYNVHFKDLSDDKIIDDVLVGTSGAVSWGHEITTVFYSTQDDAHRVDKVWMHTLGTEQDDDILIYHESDELFNAGFGRSADGKFMVVESESTETNEVHVLPITDDSDTLPALQCIAPRKQNHRYYPEHRGDFWFLLSNRNEKINFDLYRVADDSIGDESGWELVPGVPSTRVVEVPVVSTDDADDNIPVGFPYSPHRTLESISAFRDYLVLEGREDGFSQIWILQLSEDGNINRHHRSSWPSENCVVYTAVASASLSCVSANQNFNSNELLIAYSSLTTPKTVYAYDMESQTKEIIKETPMLNGFDVKQFATCRVEVTARDGVKVPVSLAWKKIDDDTSANSKENSSPPKDSPVLLSGYGSYGVSCDPSFSREDVPLLNRGVVIAIAHVRGGGEMGREWYEKQGKYLTKKNTFFDFVDVAQALVDQEITSSEQLAITGRSAGGLLIGASLNLAPELFKCAVAAVPFVDVMVSMCDSTIPLTTGEWEEWGNPNCMQFFPYMLSYSPMENIMKNTEYPSVLITSGLFDPRVAYWEGAKYAARLREAQNSEKNKILLKTDLSAGHFSASDRYKYFKEKAYEHAFVLDCLGFSGVKPKWEQ